MCVKLGMAAGIDGARLMKVARLRTERGEWNDVGKLEEASGRSQWRTRRKDQKSVLKRKEKEEGPENFGGGESSTVRTVCFWRIADNVVMRLVEGEE